MASALIDASALVAAFGAQQKNAAHNHELIQLAALEHWSLSTTWPCVMQASYLVTPPQRYTLLHWIASAAIAVFPFQQQALAEFVPLMQKYTQSPRAEMDLADASLVWLASETGVTRVMTSDVCDFSRYRLPDGRAFEIL